ncbi:hypothetical protein SAMN06264849_104258 [Melghirimyces algeriensis]|uniref:Uncharacterized protein n=1 Tax=Melghirimyces algeriensis TaxID=910412 RepID=A0A521CWF5_9BACL|nr:hypothetical protein SAMN06264849_104258 [Melghirimyces algeriensis]
MIRYWINSIIISEKNIGGGEQGKYKMGEAIKHGKRKNINDNTRIW